MLDPFIVSTKIKYEQLANKLDQIAKIVNAKEKQNDFVEVQEENAEQNTLEHNMHLDRQDQNDGELNTLEHNMHWVRQDQNDGNAIEDDVGLQQNPNHVAELNDTRGQDVNLVVEQMLKRFGFNVGFANKPKFVSLFPYLSNKLNYLRDGSFPSH
ncbi:hypothetical protein PIB30_096122 [Stylosanthes scabra]|uniref:Uncharacterized protein n=1 Tax=Stylosanthes scabra TaxID=79078 RepID=A0ABU6WU55_9FABA|nr:hypothetical protein [Stylosanthes scabra]